MKAEGVRGFDDCSAFCLADRDCVAFDLQTKCWMFTDQEKANNKKSILGVNHYKRAKVDSAECDGDNFQLNKLV